MFAAAFFLGNLSALFECDHCCTLFSVFSELFDFLMPPKKGSSRNPPKSSSGSVSSNSTAGQRSSSSKNLKKQPKPSLVPAASSASESPPSVAPPLGGQKSYNELQNTIFWVKNGPPLYLPPMIYYNPRNEYYINGGAPHLCSIHFGDRI